MIYEGKFLYHNIDRNRALWHNEGEHDIAHEHSFGYYLFTTIREVLCVRYYYIDDQCMQNIVHAIIRYPANLLRYVNKSDISEFISSSIQELFTCNTSFI